MLVIIDRFEGDVAVVELPSKETANLSRLLLPGEAAVGDVVRIEIDSRATGGRRERIAKLMADLRER